MLRRLIEQLFTPPPAPEALGAGGDDDADERFQFYATFSLKDGHLLVQELENYGLPFEIELHDGISGTDALQGSAGDRAGMTIYIEAGNREILDDLVKLHFH